MQPSQIAPSHRPPAGLLRVTPALRGDFHLTVYVGSYILLSLFLLSPTSYTFNFLEANWKGSHCLQEGHLPWRFLSSFWQSSQQQQQLKAQITEPQLTARLIHLDCNELWASRLTAEVTPLLCDTQGHSRKDFPSEDLSPVQALSSVSHAVGTKMSKRCKIPRDLHPCTHGLDYPSWDDVLWEGGPDSRCYVSQRWEQISGRKVKYIPSFSYTCKLFLHSAASIKAPELQFSSH